MTDTPLPPLHNIRVLDLSRIIAGPMCSMMLGDLGASVIKIEPPGRGDDSRGMKPPEIGGESSLYLSANRNKQSVALDVRTDEGRKIFFELAARCDVLIENFRPGTTRRLGIDYPTVAARYPQLIYCSISGYGQTGPMAERGGLDPVVQAESGMMSLNGDPNGDPLRHPIPLSDVFTAHYATQAILSALLSRPALGRGQHIDLALFDVAVASMMNFNQHYLVTNDNPPRLGNEHPSVVPVALFKTPTGPFYLALGNDRLFQALCEHVIQRPDIAQEAHYATNTARVEHREELMALLNDIFANDTRENWLRKMLDAGLPAGAVRTVSEALTAPDVLARGMMTSVSHPTAETVRLINSPIRFSETPVAQPTPPPLLGQHTDEVLGELLGYDGATIEGLRQANVIA